MVSKVQPGREALARMGISRTVSKLGLLEASYAGKFALAAFVGILLPLATFIVYLLLSRADWEAMYSDRARGSTCICTSAPAGTCAARRRGC